jgi:hypothetical protein
MEAASVTLGQADHEALISGLDAISDGTARRERAAYAAQKHFLLYGSNYVALRTDAGAINYLEVTRWGEGLT